MSKKYGRPYYPQKIKPSTNPPSGYTELFADSANSGKLSALFPDGSVEELGGGGSGGLDLLKSVETTLDFSSAFDGTAQSDSSLDSYSSISDNIKSGCVLESSGDIIVETDNDALRAFPVVSDEIQAQEGVQGVSGAGNYNGLAPAGNNDFVFCDVSLDKVYHFSYSDGTFTENDNLTVSNPQFIIKLSNSRFLVGSYQGYTTVTLTVVDWNGTSLSERTTHTISNHRCRGLARLTESRFVVLIQNASDNKCYFRCIDFDDTDDSFTQVGNDFELNSTNFPNDINPTANFGIYGYSSSEILFPYQTDYPDYDIYMAGIKFDGTNFSLAEESFFVTTGGSLAPILYKNYSQKNRIYLSGGPLSYSYLYLYEAYEKYQIADNDSTGKLGQLFNIGDIATISGSTSNNGDFTINDVSANSIIVEESTTAETTTATASIQANEGAELVLDSAGTGILVQPKKIFIKPNEVNYLNSYSYSGTAFTYIPAMVFTNNQSGNVFATFVMPKGYSGIKSVTLLHENNVSSVANLYLSLGISRVSPKDGEDNTNDISPTQAFASLGTAGKLQRIEMPDTAWDSLTFQEGDIVGVLLNRNASSASDTYEQTFNVIGIEITLE